MLRVLEIGNLYPPHAFGGYEALWRDTVAAQREAGHSVRVLCTRHRVPGAATEHEEADVHRELRWYWQDYAFPRRTMRARLDIERSNARVLRRHLHEHRPQVAVLWAMGGMSMSLIERLRCAGVPTLAVVADEWLGYAPTADGWMRAWRRLPRGAHALARVTGTPTRLELRHVSWIFISRYLAERAGRLIPLDPASVQVASPGVDSARFPSSASDDAWEWRLLYAGRVERAKGIDVALEALAGLPASTTLTVDGTGNPEFVEELRLRAGALGLARRLRMVRSPSGGLAAAYAEADCVVFPVRWNEPWGLVPLEAMAVGTPVVATSQGGLAEYLRHEENSLIVPAEDPEALGRAVRRLAGDGALRDRLRAGGLETAGRFPARAFAEAVVAATARVAGA